jgi:hypothetical protein
MTAMLRKAEIPRLVEELALVTDQVQRQFGGLTKIQLNWQPVSTEWSIGQCLEHLMITNTTYVPILQQHLAGTTVPTLWERLPGLPGFWGQLMLKALDPENPQRIQSPAIFRPKSSRASIGIVADFVAHQAQMTELMQAAQTLPTAQIIISSPAARWMTYSLLDAFRIMVVHEQCHVRQMHQVAQSTTFPAAVDLMEPVA